MAYFYSLTYLALIGFIQKITSDELTWTGPRAKVFLLLLGSTSHFQAEGHPS